LELPQSLIAVSLGAALLPRFSDLNTSGERGKFLGEANQAVRMLLYLTLPAAVGMWVLAAPITEVLFMRGAFNPTDAAATSSIVEIYAVLMLFSSLSRVTAPAFYAMKNTWLPAAVAFFVLIVHILVGSWAVDIYGLTGLATATSASSILNIIILQICFFFMIGPLGYGSILISAAKMLPGLAALGAFCYYVYPVTLEALAPFCGLMMARTVTLTLVIALGSVLYFFVTSLTGSETAEKVVGILRRRLRKGA
jgi:putative peptidoglycan lipid II flippase